MKANKLIFYHVLLAVKSIEQIEAQNKKEQQKMFILSKSSYSW